MMNPGVIQRLRVWFGASVMATWALLIVLMAAAGPTTSGHPLAQATPTPTCSSPPAGCTVARRYGWQPSPTAMVGTFDDAARNALGGSGPMYPQIARGMPAGYPGGTGITYLSISAAEPLPATILKAVGWRESDWSQFDNGYGRYGCTYVSYNSDNQTCDYGVMQLNQNSMSDMDSGRIAGEYRYNVGAGTRWLIGSSSGWNYMSTPTYRLIHPNNHTLIEGWYYAVTAYNGWGSKNDPHNQTPPYQQRLPQRPPYREGNYGSYDYPYQEQVWGYVAHSDTRYGQLWSAVRVPWVPRGIWGTGQPTDWNRPAEWTSRPTFYCLPDVLANWGGWPWDSYLLLQNAITPTYNYTLAADIALYSANGDFNRWWLSPPDDPHAPPVRLASRTLHSLKVGDVFGGNAYSGPSLVCAGQDVGVVVQNVAPGRAYAYVGVALPGSAPDVGYSLAGTTVHLPLLMDDYNGWSTVCSIQNAGAQATQATLIYYDAQGHQVYSTNFDLLPGAAATYGQLGSVCPPLGSGRVTANQPLAVTVLEKRGATGPTTVYNALTRGAAQLYVPLLLADYSGWPAGLGVQQVGLANPRGATGDYQVYLPLVMAYHQWYTDLVVQNVGAQPTTITVHYYSTSGSSKPDETRENVAPGQSVIFRTLGGSWIGAARVTSSNGEPLAAIVNQVSPNGNQVGSYSGATGGATRVLLPLAAKAYANWRSVVAVQNLGGSSTTVTLDYRNVDGTPAGNQTVPIGQQWQSYVFYPLPVGDGFVGSIVVSSNPHPIAVVMNMLEGDARMMTYNGLPR